MSKAFDSTPPESGPRKAPLRLVKPAEVPSVTVTWRNGFGLGDLQFRQRVMSVLDDPTIVARLVPVDAAPGVD